MPAGRPPQPKQIAMLKGNRRRKKESEPKAPEGMPTCPEYLDEIAKEEWQSITAHLQSMGILSITDRQIIEQYCVSYSRWRKAGEMLQKFGDVILSVNKQTPMYSPYGTAFDRSQEQCRKLLIELGLTPAARSRMRIADKEETDNKWSGLLKSVG